MFEGGYGEYYMSSEISARQAALADRSVALRRELATHACDRQDGAGAVMAARRSIGQGLAGARRAVTGAAAAFRGALTGMAAERRGLAPSAGEGGGD